MFDKETPGAPEAGKGAPEGADAALDQKKDKVRREADKLPPGVDDKTLQLRTKPDKEDPEDLKKRKQIDLSDDPKFRTFNESVLKQAKVEMRKAHKAAEEEGGNDEYGDVDGAEDPDDKLTVDDARFVLGVGKDGVAKVAVTVIGESSGDPIVQYISLEEEDDEGELVYKQPPLSDNDVDTIDPEVSKLA